MSSDESDLGDKEEDEILKAYHTPKKSRPSMSSSQRSHNSEALKATPNSAAATNSHANATP